MSDARVIGRASVGGVPCDVYEDPDGRQWVFAYGSRLYGLWLPKEDKQAPRAASDERITLPPDTGIPSIPPPAVPPPTAEQPTAAAGATSRRPWVWLAALVAFGGAFVAIILMAPRGTLPNLLGPRPAATTLDPAAAQVPGADSSKPSPTKATYTSEELYRLASPGVVTLTLKNDSGKSVGLGSGFFVADELVHDPDAWVHRKIVEWRSKEGRPQQFAYVLTNYHVIEPAVDAEISLSDGSKGYVCEVVTEDEVADLALLTVFVNSANPVTRLQLAERAPSVGASVYAIGSPRGLANSLSAGIISGIREVKPGISRLQTTAPISPGSSGGPLLNPNGEVVGVTTAIRRDGQNLNFAIPASELRLFLSAPYITRPLWKGRSYLQELEYTFDTKLGLAWTNRKFKGEGVWSGSDPESLLWKARRQISEDKVYDAIQTLSSEKASIPHEYKYLYHFLLGDCYYTLAARTIDRLGPTTSKSYHDALRSNAHNKSAIEALKQAVQLNSSFAPAYALLTECHWCAGEWAEGLLAAESLVKLMPQCAEAYRKRGRCLSGLHRYASAMEDFQAALKLAPDDYHTHAEIAGAWVYLEECEKAIDSYKTAISLCPDAPAYYYNLGLTYKIAQKYPQAIRAYEEARSHGMPAASCDAAISECRKLMR